jgi:hypothetical protein
MRVLVLSFFIVIMPLESFAQCFVPATRMSEETNLWNQAQFDKSHQNDDLACGGLNQLIEMYEEDLDMYQQCGIQSMIFSTQSLLRTERKLQQNWGC